MERKRKRQEEITRERDRGEVQREIDRGKETEGKRQREEKKD